MPDHRIKVMYALCMRRLNQPQSYSYEDMKRDVNSLFNSQGALFMSPVGCEVAREHGIHAEVTGLSREKV